MFDIHPRFKPLKLKSPVVCTAIPDIALALPGDCYDWRDASSGRRYKVWYNPAVSNDWQVVLDTTPIVPEIPVNTGNMVDGNIPVMYSSRRSYAGSYSTTAEQSTLATYMNDRPSHCKGLLAWSAAEPASLSERTRWGAKAFATIDNGQIIDGFITDCTKKSTGTYEVTMWMDADWASPYNPPVSAVAITKNLNVILKSHEAPFVGNIIDLRLTFALYNGSSLTDGAFCFSVF